MSSLSLNRFKRSRWPFEKELIFPSGLYGFDQYQHFVLMGNREEKPFLWLTASDHRFVAVDPFLVCPDYRPTLLKQDLDTFMVGKESSQLFLLAIVRSRESGFTLNLASPLLIDWERKQGCQLLIPDQPSEYSIIDR